MKYVRSNCCSVFKNAETLCPEAPIIYIIDSPEHPFDIDAVVQMRSATIVSVPVDAWNDSLTPWPAPGLYREEADFGGKAATTLAEIVDEVIPTIELSEGHSPAQRAICGYSLGGLFSLYAFATCSHFDACACLSGSVWYEGWKEYLDASPFDGTGRFAFLSIGRKEKHAAPPILHGVENDMRQCTEILRDHGCETEFVVGPGNHMAHIRERFDAGIDALERYFAKTARE